MTVTAQAQHKTVKGSSDGGGESSDDGGMWTETNTQMKAPAGQLFGVR